MSNSISKDEVIVNILDLKKCDYTKIESNVFKLKNIFSKKIYSEFKSKIRKKQYVLSTWLIYLFLKQYNISSSKLVRVQNKKPYIKSNNVYFSISHANNLVGIAISIDPVGFDIEESTTKYSRGNVYKYMPKISKIRWKKDFIKSWCEYESLYKLNNNLKTKAHNFYHHKINSKYKCCVCSSKKKTKITYNI